MIYERLHTREIGEMGGMWKSVPVLTALFVVAMFAGIGLPGLLRVHRRVPVADRAFLVRPIVRDRRHDRGDLRGGLHALAVQDGVHRRFPRVEATMKDLERSRARGRRAAAGALAVHRPLPEAGARPHRAGREAGGAELRAQDRLPRPETGGPRKTLSEVEKGCRAKSGPRTPFRGGRGSDRRPSSCLVGRWAIAPIMASSRIASAR